MNNDEQVLDESVINQKFDVAAAEKKAKTIKPNANTSFVIVEIGYSNTLVLPFKAGIQLAATLEQAETLRSEYSNGGENYYINPLEKDKIKLTIMSLEQYQNIKAANILDIPSSMMQKK